MREIVHESKGGYGRHLSLSMIEAKPFASARVKQGGYGFHDKDFWVQRTADRNFHVFIFTFSGKGRLVFEDGTERILREGDAFISWSSGQGHFEESYGDEPWEHLWITIWDTSPNYVPDRKDYRIVKNNNIMILKDLILKIFEEDSLGDGSSEEALEAYEQLFLINMNRILGLVDNSLASKQRRKFAALWNKVSTDIARTWTIAELCEEVGYSKPHLSRLCQELYNKSPAEKVREIKMNNAKALLRNSDRSISDIGKNIGYESPSVFSVAFHEYFGISPRDFRKYGSHRSGRR